MIDDTQRRKRLEDEIAGAKAGFDTSAEDDARLQQSSGQDMFAEEAEETINFLRKHEPYYWRLHDPQELAKLREELIQGSMEQAGLRRREPQQQEEEPFSSEKFWSNPEEVKRAWKAKHPTRL